MALPPPANDPPFLDHADDSGIELEVLINPQAGDADTMHRYRHIALQSRRARLTEVTSPDETQHLLQAFAERDERPRVAIAGGDGTINSACRMNAELNMPLEMALLACGTANDFAQGLGIPLEPTEAWRIARHGRTRDVTLGLCLETGETFGNIASGGVSHAIAERLDEEPELKQAWGRMAYTRVAAAEAMDPPQYDVTITVDGHTERHTVEAVLIANSPRTGGQVLLPEASPFDARLDVVLLTTSTLGERVNLLTSLMKGELARHELCHHRQGLRIEVKAKPEMRFVLDGEPMERATPLTFVLHDKRVPIAIDPA